MHILCCFYKLQWMMVQVADKIGLYPPSLQVQDLVARRLTRGRQNGQPLAQIDRAVQQGQQAVVVHHLKRVFFQRSEVLRLPVACA